MAMHRIASHAIAPGDDLDQFPVLHVWDCDGCGKRTDGGVKSSLTRIQGQAYYQAQTGVINADLCPDCMVNISVGALVKGITL